MVLFSLFLPVVLAAPPHGGESHSNKFKSRVAFCLEGLLLWVVSISGVVSMYRRIRKCAVFSKLHPHLSEGCAQSRKPRIMREAWGAGGHDGAREVSMSSCILQRDIPLLTAKEADDVIHLKGRIPHVLRKWEPTLIGSTRVPIGIPCLHLKKKNKNPPRVGEKPSF